MISLLDCGLKNVAYFKDVAFKFKPGISFVYGKNLNARRSGASNGAGKSSLFLSLYHILGFDIPVVRGKAAVRSTFTKGSQSHLSIIKNNHKWVFRKKPGAFDITKDGKNIKIRTPTLAAERVAKMFDISEDEFYTLVFLDSGRPHTFQAGTVAQRFAFFTEMFRLDDMDNIRRWVKTKISELNTANNDRSRLEEEKSELLEDLNEHHLPDLRTKYASMLEKQKAYLTDQQSIMSKMHDLDLWERELKSRQRMAEIRKSLRIERNTNIESEIEKAKTNIKKSERLAAQHEAYGKYIKRLNKLKFERNVLGEELGIKYSLEDLEYSLEDIHVAIRDYEKRLDEIQDISKPEHVEKNEAAHEVLSDVEITDDLEDRFKRHLVKMEERFEAAEAALESFSSAFAEDSCTCPTCYSKLSGSAVKTTLSMLKSNVDVALKKKKRARKLIDALRHVHSYTEYQSQLKLFKESEAAAEDINPKRLQQLRDLESVLMRIGNLEEVSKPVGEPADVAKLTTRLSSLNELSSHAVRIDDDVRIRCEKLLAVTSYESLELQLGKVRTGAGKLNSRIPELKSRIDRLTEKKKRVAEIDSELETIKGELEDLPIYQALLEAYGPAGIKLLLIKKMAMLLEKNLNRSAHVLFREDFKFSLSVGNNEFSAFVHRKSAQGERVSDIRHLSGAERRVFSWLFALSALPLVPESRRFDTLVLDEPTANLDSDLIEVFRDKLLPKLNKVVPKIVVITPDSQLKTPNANTYTVVKRGNESTLVEGSV